MTTKTKSRKSTSKATQKAPSAAAAAVAATVPGHIQAEMIEDLQAQLAEKNEQLAAMSRERGAAAPAPVRARVAPVAPRSMVDAGDNGLGSEGEVRMDTTADARSSLQRPEVEVPDGPPAKNYLEELAFMNEQVTVIVHESSDPLAEPLPEIRCNGRLQIFPRGQEVVCRRAFVEVLARAKPIHYSSQEYIDGDGNKAIKYPQKKSLRYPFSVVDDPNPRGRAWLKQVLAQA